MSPSADPVAKYSSCGSIAIHLTAFSCAVNLCRIAFDLTSIRQTSPRFPAEISTWCWGANTKLLDPWSWQVNATTKAFPWGRIESQMQTFLLSELWPAEKSVRMSQANSKSTYRLPTNCTILRKRNRWCLCCDTGESATERLLRASLVHVNLQRRASSRLCWVPLGISWDFRLNRRLQIYFRAGRISLLWLWRKYLEA